MKKGSKCSITTIKKMSEARMGDKNPMWEQHHTKKAKEKIRKSRIDKHNSPKTEFKKGHGSKPKIKIVCKQCGKIFEVIPSRAKRTNYCSNQCKHIAKIGIIPSQETRDKMKKNHADVSGEKNHFWQGGKSFEPYSVDWTETLKRSIRERDKYTCQLCGEPQGDIAHCIHHIDYNKLNSNTDNLITLCRSCHQKTNFNREYWKKYFKN